MQVQKNASSPPHPIPCDVCPKCRVSHVCKRKRTSASPPHVMRTQSVEPHMCASAKERHHPHHPIPCDVCPKCRVSHVCKCKRTSSPPPTPSHVMCAQSVESHMCAQSVESHMCASAKERQHPHPTPPHPM